MLLVQLRTIILLRLDMLISLSVKVKMLESQLLLIVSMLASKEL